jgi:hypothetical protein
MEPDFRKPAIVDRNIAGFFADFQDATVTWSQLECMGLSSVLFLFTCDMTRDAFGVMPLA